MKKSIKVQFGRVLLSAVVALTVASGVAQAQVRGSGPNASRGSYIRTGVAANAMNYAEMVVRISRAKRVEPELVMAVITVESRGNPDAVSGSGARGLMQLMPSTCQDLGVTDPHDPEQNIQGGVALLARHLRKYGGHLEKTLAAYNAGPRRVTDGSYKKLAETMRYIPRVLDIYSALKRSPEWMAGITFEPEPAPVIGDPTGGISTPPPTDPTVIVTTTPPGSGTPSAPETTPAPEATPASRVPVARPFNNIGEMQRIVTEKQKMTEFGVVAVDSQAQALAQKLLDAEIAEPMTSHRQATTVEKMFWESGIGRAKMQYRFLRSGSDRDFPVLWAKEQRINGNQLGLAYGKDANGQSVWVVIILAR